MRFSKWHALGNSYLLVERSEVGSPLTPTQAHRLCDVHSGIGSDGVLEVVSVDGTRAEVVIWNPDGSTAEMSGNGVRIAARWLAARAGADRGHGPRRPARGRRARILGARDVEQDMGAVEVGETETIDVDGEAVEFTPVSVGNPHAVVLRPPVREHLLRLGPRIERHPRFPERTNVQLVGVDGPHELTAARLGARRGGDVGLGFVRRRGRGRRRRPGPVREPGHRPPAGRRSRRRDRDGRPRRPHRPGRADLLRRGVPLDLDGDLELAQHGVEADAQIVRLCRQPMMSAQSS